MNPRYSQKIRKNRLHAMEKKYKIKLQRDQPQKDEKHKLTYAQRIKNNRALIKKRKFGVTPQIRLRDNDVKIEINIPQSGSAQNYITINRNQINHLISKLEEEKQTEILDILSQNKNKFIPTGSFKIFNEGKRLEIFDFEPFKILENITRNKEVSIRGLGVGTKILNNLFKKARTEGIEEIKLKPNKDSKEFYRQNGFYEITPYHYVKPLTLNAAKIAARSCILGKEKLTNLANAYMKQIKRAKRIEDINKIMKRFFINKSLRN
jgi:hypothetical protein